MGGATMDFPKSFKGNAPASDSVIQTFEQQSGIKLPDQYVRFLKTMNGGEGFVGANYLVVFPIEKLIEYNRGYGFDKWVPDLLLFGSNGAGEGFAFDRCHAAWPVVMVPFVPLEVQNAISVSESFNSLFDSLLKRDLADLI